MPLTLTSTVVNQYQFLATGSVAFVMGPTSSRALLTVYNNSNQDLFIGYGTAPTSSSFAVKVPQSGYYETPIPVYQGQIFGLYPITGSGGANVYDFS